MVAFAPIVQADLSGTAFGGVPTWTDITRFAQQSPTPIRITKWRQDQLSDVAPSTMTLVLDNMDLPADATAPNAGRFTPFLGTAPWSPHILPGVRIRAGVTVNAVTYWRFDGYVDVWDASYDNGEFGICTVSASDMLGRLGIVDVLRAQVIEEVLLDAPASFYTLGEPAAATAAADLTAKQADATVQSGKYGAGAVTFGNSPTMVGVTGSMAVTSPDANVAAGATSHARATWLQAPNVVRGLTSFAFELWFLAPSSAPSVATETLLVTQAHATNVDGGSVAIDTAGRLSIGFSGGVFTTASSICDGLWHHLVINVNYGGTTTVYLDGASAFIAATTLGTIGAYPWTLGAQADLVTGAVFGPYSGALALFAQYTANLTPARIAAHAAAGRTAFAGEGTATHIARLLGYRTNLGSTLDAGQGTVGTQAITGATVQQALLDTAKAEGGLVYADPATGKIVFLDRTHLRDPAAAVTLDITAQQTTADLNVRADRDLLLNDVTINRPGGATQRMTDQTSKNTYGTKGLSETRIIGSDQDAANATGWLVANGKDVRARTPLLSVDLLSEPSLTVAAAVLGLTPLQRVTLSNPPTSMPATDVVVQGCTDTIGAEVFTCAFNVSPMPRPTLRFDAVADAFTKLDSGNVFAW